MMDIVDKSEADLQRASIQAARASAVLTRQGVGITARVGRRMSVYSLNALLALLRQAREITRSRQSTGELSLRQFSRNVTGSREILPISDREIARELARELRRHGVTFAVERNSDGSRYFHVEGRSAELVEHALRRAAERIDERITRAAERRGQAEPAAELDAATDRAVVVVPEADRERLAEAVRRAGRISPELDEAARFAQASAEIREQGQLTMTAALSQALDAAHIGAEEFSSPDLAGQLTAAMAEDRAAEAVTPTQAEEAERSAVSVPAVDNEPIEAGAVVLDVQGRERVMLVDAIDQHAAELGGAGLPKEITLTDDQRETLVAALNEYRGYVQMASLGDSGPAEAVVAITDAIEQTGVVGRDQETVATVRDMFLYAGWSEPDPEVSTVPYDMVNVVESVQRAALSDGSPVTVYTREGCAQSAQTVAWLQEAGIAHRTVAWDNPSTDLQVQAVLPGAFVAPVVVDHTRAEAWPGHRPDRLAGLAAAPDRSAVEFVDLADELRRDGTVQLDVATVERLGEVFDRQGWQAGDDATPPTVRWVVDHVEAERDRPTRAQDVPVARETTPAPSHEQPAHEESVAMPDRAGPPAQNPYLVDANPPEATKEGETRYAAGRTVVTDVQPQQAGGDDLRNTTRQRIADRIASIVGKAKDDRGAGREGPTPDRSGHREPPSPTRGSGR